MLIRQISDLATSHGSWSNLIGQNAATTMVQALVVALMHEIVDYNL